MMNVGSLQVSTPSDREIAMTRVFNAPRRLVFDAWTKPELVRRWLGGLDGWEMSVCEIDLHVGGAYRYVWRRTDGSGEEMGMGGVYQEIVRPERIVATESFDQSWYPGDALDTIELVETDEKTTLIETVRYESKEARDMVLQSPATEGVAAGFDRLAALLATLA